MTKKEIKLLNDIVKDLQDEAQKSQTERWCRNKRKNYNDGLYDGCLTALIKLQTCFGKYIKD